MANRHLSIIPATEPSHNRAFSRPAADQRSVPGWTTTIYRPVANVDGLRVAHSLATTVSVYIGPAVKISELIEFGALKNRPLVYVLAAHGLLAYIGRSGDGDRRLCDQLKKYTFSEEAFAVCWNDARIGDKTAEYFEARFVELAMSAGTKLANKAVPKLPNMSAAEASDHEHLVYDARLILHDAGCRVLDPLAPLSDKKSSKDGQAIVGIGSLNIPPGAPMFKMTRSARFMFARAVQVDGSFFVLPGSEYWLEPNPSLVRPIKLRRQAIEKQKILEPHPDNEKVARLLAYLECKSAASAAKILTGWHIGSRAWERVPSTPLVHVTG
jgi:hypothetical protein